MPLKPPALRRKIHNRVIDMQAWAREDGLFDVEARLVDTKPFAYPRFSNPGLWPADAPIHDLSVRLSVDADMFVREVDVSTDTTPYPVCTGAARTLDVLVGERIARGWSKRVKELLHGAASCTHLMEMLIPMGTTALQGIRTLKNEAKMNPADHVHKVDTCFAYGASREVVRQFWPERYKPDAQR